MTKNTTGTMIFRRDLARSSNSYDPVRLQVADLQLDLVRHEAQRGDQLLQ